MPGLLVLMPLRALGLQPQGMQLLQLHGLFALLVFALMFVRSAVTSVESMNMTIVRIAQALVITAPNNAERWPPEKNSNYQTRFGGVLYSR